MSPTCGPANTLMVLGYSGDISPDPSTCTDKITIGGVPLTGRKIYDANDNRWTLSVSVPDGVSGEVIAACAYEVSFGKFTQPCPPGGTTQSAFEAFRGDLVMMGSCDDADSKVTLQNFTLTSFEMTGLTGNQVVRFRIVDDKTAISEGSDVVQFGKGGHHLRIVIVDGKLQMSAQSSEGSCASTLSKRCSMISASPKLPETYARRRRLSGSRAFACAAAVG